MGDKDETSNGVVNIIRIRNIMERDRSIDIAKGIAILLVVVGHSHCVTGLAHQIIYSFHMPLFFIFAGWFYKKRDIAVSMKKDFMRLIVPYLVFGGICALKFSVTSAMRHDWQNIIEQFLGILWATTNRSDDLIWGEMPSTGIIWFLPALFWCKNIYNIISVKFSKPHIKLPIVVIISVLTICLDRYVINIPSGILPGCGAMIYFAIGHLLKNIRIRNWQWFIGGGVWIYCIFYSELVIGNSHYGMLPLDIIGAVFATMIVYRFSQCVSHRYQYLSSMLSWCGRNSMIIYCMHYIVIIIDPNTRLAIHDWYLWLMIDFSMILPLSYACTKLKLTKQIFQIR